MKQITKYIGLVAIVAVFAIATVSGSMGDADAIKASGNEQVPTKSYGSATDDIVCGDKLCASGDGSDPVNKSNLD